MNSLEAEDKYFCTLCYLEFDDDMPALICPICGETLIPLVDAEEDMDDWEDDFDTWDEV